MVASISLDLRKRVVEAYGGGKLTYDEVAERFSIGRASVSRWLRRARETGDPIPLAHAGGRVCLIRDENLKLLEKLVLAHPDWTEDEYTKAFNQQTHLSLSDSTVGRAIRRLGYGVKKSPSLRPKKNGQTSSSGVKPTTKKPKRSPLRVLFLWTKPVSTPR